MDKQTLKYTNLIVDLLDLIGEGKCDTDEADDVRDKLDEIKLPDGTPRYIEDLAGDLYMTHGDDMYFALGEEETKEDYLLRLDNAIKADRWGEVLELLKASLGLDRALIAEYRGRAWKHLGNNKAAEKFTSYAKKLRDEK